MIKGNQKLESGGNKSSAHNSSTKDYTPESRERLVYSSQEISRSRNVIDQGFQTKRSYGTINDDQNHSLGNLQGVKNLRSLRESKSTSSLRNSVKGEDRENNDLENSILGEVPKETPGMNKTKDKYILLAGLIFLICFDVLLFIRLENIWSVLKIWVALPLIFGLLFVNLFIVRQVWPFFKAIDNKATYYTVAILKVISSKLILGIILVEALSEISPFYKKKVIYIEWITVAVLLIWVPVIMYFYKEIQRFSHRLPFLLLQNLILFDCFLALLFNQMNMNYKGTFIVFLPLWLNFGLNMISCYRNQKEDAETRNKELLVNGLLEVAMFWIWVYIDYLHLNIVALILMITYIVAIKIYFYTLAI